MILVSDDISKRWWESLDIAQLWVFGDWEEEDSWTILGMMREISDSEDRRLVED
jgi:hypothetical protein